MLYSWHIPGIYWYVYISTRCTIASVPGAMPGASRTRCLYYYEYSYYAEVLHVLLGTGTRQHFRFFYDRMRDSNLLTRPKRGTTAVVPQHRIIRTISIKCEYTDAPYIPGQSGTSSSGPPFELLPVRPDSTVRVLSYDRYSTSPAAETPFLSKPC